jgi:hypothetical protein
MSDKIIILISEGRSGTNGIYRHIFANKILKIEPFINTTTGSKQTFKQTLTENVAYFSHHMIIHIKPSHLWASHKKPKLEYNDFIDACIEIGINNFIVLKRRNILARLASNPNSNNNYKKKCEIVPDKLLTRLKKGHTFEKNVIEYLEKLQTNYIELTYEEHIKPDVNLACKLITDKFTWLPKDYLTYSESANDTKKLKSFEQNNNLLDKRPMHARISNVDDIKPILKKYKSIWMLEY